MKELNFTPWAALAGALLLMNFITFIVYGADKRKAKKSKRRIPESNLLWFAALGGSLGALFAMRVFQHKTKHLKFTIGVPLLLLLQVALCAAAVWLARG